MTHNEKSGVAHFAVDDDRACLALIRKLLSVSPEQQPRRPRLRSSTTDPPDREDEALDHLVPASPNQPYDMLDLIHAIADEGAFLEVHQHFARNIIVGFARLGGRSGRHRRQSAGASRRGARHRRVGEGRAVRAVLRRVQHPARHVRRCPGFPARHGAGIRRHHQARSQAAVRVRRSDRAEGDGHHAQGIRRRLLRDVEQAHAYRLQLRVADGRGRGDGPRRRGQRAVSRGARNGGRPGGRARRGAWPSSARSLPARSSRPPEGS